MSGYTQCLLSGQVPTLGYGRPIGHVLNEISNTTWYNQLAKRRYNSLAIKNQQTKKCDNRSLHKNYSATVPSITRLHNNLLKPAVLTVLKNPLLPLEKNPTDDQVCLCADQLFSNFLRMSTIHQIYHFATPHLC